MYETVSTANGFSCCFFIWLNAAFSLVNSTPHFLLSLRTIGHWNVTVSGLWLFSWLFLDCFFWKSFGQCWHLKLGGSCIRLWFFKLPDLLVEYVHSSQMNLLMADIMLEVAASVEIEVGSAGWPGSYYPSAPSWELQPPHSSGPFTDLRTKLICIFVNLYTNQLFWQIGLLIQTETPNGCTLIQLWARVYCFNLLIHAK